MAATLRGLYGAEVAGQLGAPPGLVARGAGDEPRRRAAAGAASLWRACAAAAARAGAAAAWARPRRRARRLQRRRRGAARRSRRCAALAFGRGLPAGFALLGGAAARARRWRCRRLLPAILALGGRARARAGRRWVWADTRQAAGRLSLALMALLLALAVNVGVGTMVESFRLTFIGWLDQRLAAELYVDRRDRRRGGGDRRLARGPAGGRRGAADLARARRACADWPVEVYGFRDHATYRDNWPLLAAAPDAWDRVARGDGGDRLRAARPPRRPRPGDDAGAADPGRPLADCRWRGSTPTTATRSAR